MFSNSHVFSPSPYFFFFLLIPPPPSSTLFPYTTLFRSPPLGTIQPDEPTPRAPGCPAKKAAFSLFFSQGAGRETDRKSTRLNSSHTVISYAVFCLKKKKKTKKTKKK